MERNENRGFLIRLYIVIALCIGICAGMIVLLGRDTTVRETVSAGMRGPLYSGVETLPQKQQEPEYDTVSDDSLLKVADYAHMIDEGYVPSDLVDVNVPSNGTIQLRRECADAVKMMFEAAQADGIGLYLISGYRSVETQQKLWDTYVRMYGESEAHRMDAYPCVSEHMLGLSVDLGTTDRVHELEDQFAFTDAYAWLVDHACEYGFILRYPQGKEDVTGISFSPWSFRYVGVDMAVKIQASGLCMEEYFEVN
ncbi:MAG: M15 family metallopeptidase [Bulleidia sp.]